MKTHVLRTSILAMLLAVAGHAQSPLPLRADILFNFVAGNATLNAGPYTVDQGHSGLILTNEIGGREDECVPVRTHDAKRRHTVRFQAGFPSLRKHLRAVADLDCGKQLRPSGAGYPPRARTGGEAHFARRDHCLSHALNQTVLRQAREGLSQDSKSPSDFHGRRHTIPSPKRQAG